MTFLTRRRTFNDLENGGAIVVKTCGIMQVEHARTAALSGTSMVGLVFAHSKRTVSPEFALSVRLALDELPSRPLLVGVFVNESPISMRDIAQATGLDILQLSGDESPADVARCAEYYPVLKAFRFTEEVTLEQARNLIESYRRLVPPSRLRFLVDSYHPGEYGGTGMLSNWGVASALAEEEPVMLAGGLTPRNVADAIETVKPWGVDVSSGIERDGAKAPNLIRDFIARTHLHRYHKETDRRMASYS